MLPQSIATMVEDKRSKRNVYDFSSSYHQFSAKKKKKNSVSVRQPIKGCNGMQRRVEEVNTLRNIVLPRRTSGTRPHAAKATRAAAGINRSITGFPRNVSYDLKFEREI